MSSAKRIAETVLPAGTDALIDRALAEDIGSGDHTTLSCIPESAHRNARLLVKEPGIIAGVQLALHLINRFDESIVIDVLMEDGAEVQIGDVAFTLTGPARSILTIERLALNFMQRMSGIATLTRQFVDAVEGTGCVILDTRKTTPGLRGLEKWAVRIGGGSNHRTGLYDMIMIKDNHVDFAGGISNAIKATQAYLKKNGMEIPVEVETRNMKEVEEVLDVGGVDRIMLDNFSPSELRKAVTLIDGRFETEASGGITLATVASYAEQGVDYISVGALTHSVKSLDLSLKAF